MPRLQLQGCRSMTRQSKGRRWPEARCISDLFAAIWRRNEDFHADGERRTVMKMTDFSPGQLRDRPPAGRRVLYGEHSSRPRAPAIAYAARRPCLHPSARNCATRCWTCCGRQDSAVRQVPHRARRTVPLPPQLSGRHDRKQSKSSSHKPHQYFLCSGVLCLARVALDVAHIVYRPTLIQCRDKTANGLRQDRSQCLVIPPGPASLRFPAPPLPCVSCGTASAR